jgi:DNA-directed RNA polymerase specialized sigma24 family protein
MRDANACSDHEDARLLARIAAGDRRAFERLYHLYFARLTRFLHRSTRSLPLVEEIVDDTMLVVWTKAPSWDASCKVSTWIFAIAWRRARKALGSRSGGNGGIVAAPDADPHAENLDLPPMPATLAYARLAPRLGAQEGGAGARVRWARLAAANDPRWLRAAAAVQLGVIFVLGLVVVWPGGHRAEGARRDAAGYSTLGARAAAPGNLVVSFDPATPERELRRILQASGARIVDGPTAAGAYVLDVAVGDAGPTLSSLRAEPAVTLAEPLADGSLQ